MINGNEGVVNTLSLITYRRVIMVDFKDIKEVNKLLHKFYKATDELCTPNDNNEFLDIPDVIKELQQRFTNDEITAIALAVDILRLQAKADVLKLKHNRNSSDISYQ